MQLSLEIKAKWVQQHLHDEEQKTQWEKEGFRAGNGINVKCDESLNDLKLGQILFLATNYPKIDQGKPILGQSWRMLEYLLIHMDKNQSLRWPLQVSNLGHEPAEVIRHPNKDSTKRRTLYHGTSVFGAIAIAKYGKLFTSYAHEQADHEMTDSGTWKRLYGACFPAVWTSQLYETSRNSYSATR